MLGSTLSAELPYKTRTGNTLLEILSPVAADLPRVEEALARQVQMFDPRLSEQIQYILGGAGKRLRPSLALLAGGATSEIGDRHITLGVIVELIHVATLVHDDVLDEADLRHRLPTSNSRWGNEISVLLGDCLFAHALKLAANYPTTEVCRKVSEATNTVCSGEILQTQRRYDFDLTVDHYLEIINMKTGALFAVSCELGALLNGATPTVVKAMQDYGSNLGIAYQIFDDCVDLFGQERQAGKSLGTDVKKGKLTLPLLLLLRHLPAERREQVSAMIFRNDPAEWAELLAMITSNGVMNESLATIGKFISRAEVSLDLVSANVYSRSLRALAGYLSAESRRLLTEPAAA